MIDWPKVVQDLEAENARLKKDVEQIQMALREQVELNKNLERKCAAQKTSFYVTMLKLFPEKSHDEIAKEIEVLLGEDVPTTTYLNGAAEGKKHTNALVAAAYRAAAESVKQLNNPENSDDYRMGAIWASERILALTPADAENVLRELIESAVFKTFVFFRDAPSGEIFDPNIIVDEVMKR